MNDQSDKPLSEQFRIVAKAYVDLDSAASILEETKTLILSQRMKALGDMPVSKAEMTVKASAEWEDFILKMINARTQANYKKYQLEFLRMRASEWQSANANRRAEMRL